MLLLHHQCVRVLTASCPTANKIITNNSEVMLDLDVQHARYMPHYWLPLCIMLCDSGKPGIVHDKDIVDSA